MRRGHFAARRRTSRASLAPPIPESETRPGGAIEGDRKLFISAALALGLVAIQVVTITFAPWELVVRAVLPLTIAGVPLALWPHRRHLGIWVMFVGLGANILAMVANGGLMPIERATIVQAAGEEKAARYDAGSWIAHSKDVLVKPGQGVLVPLGDSLVVPIGSNGFVASPGDAVVAAGLLLLLGEAAYGWLLVTRRPVDTSAAERVLALRIRRVRPPGAQGGASTPQ
ncbi:MAG: DUF5317 family protein [Dehalococcoidia bacterium]